MAYYSAEEIKRILEQHPYYREKLYCRGFLITNDRQKELEEYPFYAQWTEKIVYNSGLEYYFYTHKDTNCYIYPDDDITLFLIGHAYDPFNMKIDEMDILNDLALAIRVSEKTFWEAESNLTGVFCVGVIKSGNVIFSTDCAGMQLVYYGNINEKLYITSHSKLVADHLNLKQTEYIKRLVNNRFWHYWGTWLPGDLSPYAELKRMQPNFACKYNVLEQLISVERYYPTHKIIETTTEEDYQKTICELCRIMKNSMTLIAQKWNNKKVSISVTGGRDSMTTLASTYENYKKYSYFSYISNYDESVDAYAAKDILEYMELKHELFEIPKEWDEYDNFEVFKKIMECNAGCIGSNNTNDIKKRMFFSKYPPCDIEVKSWVNEIGRAYLYGKYNKKRFPKNPYPSYWRCMHKAYIDDFWIIKKTDEVFSDYLTKYYNKQVFENMSWVDLWFWEFSWSGGEGVFLTSEHRISNEITIPFNNRKYIELMLTVPLEKRKKDSIPKDMIHIMEPRIENTGIVIKDVSHTNLRSFVIRTYLEVFSKIRFWNK